MNKFYKIRNKDTGLFSRGGERPDFNKLGKVWKLEGHLKSHLNQVKSNIYENCEIVTYETREASSEDVGSKLEKIKNKKDQEAEIGKVLEEAQAYNRKMNQYYKLKKELGIY